MPVRACAPEGKVEDKFERSVCSAPVRMPAPRARPVTARCPRKGFAMTHRHLIELAALAALTIPSLARANARLIGVVPTDGGCVSGPTGATVQFWDVEPGRTYQLTISNVTECANGGTDPTLNVRVNSSNTGNTNLVATRVVPG